MFYSRNGEKNANTYYFGCVCNRGNDSPFMCRKNFFKNE